MEQLREALDAALQQTTFDGLPADEYRALVQGHSWRDEAYERSRSAPVEIAEHPRSLLTDLIRAQLISFVDPGSDSIGHSFPIYRSLRSLNESQPNGTATIASVSTVERFVAALVRGAAVLGTRRMLILLDGWRSGEPVQHRVRTLLNGDVVLSEALEPIAGVRVESLAISTDEIGEFPPLPREWSLTNYLGRMVVTIEHPTSPALFRPGDEGAVQSLSAAGTPGVRAICQALSLEVDYHLSPAFSWHDYGELDAGCLTNRTGTWSFGPDRYRPRSSPGILRTNFPTVVTKLKMDPEARLQVDQRRFRATLMALNTADAKTRRAVSRWLSSKDGSQALEDRHIDMRIALESLYLQDFLNDRSPSQEMRFRLPLFAAWHLGAIRAERDSPADSQRIRHCVGCGPRRRGRIQWSQPEPASQNPRALSARHSQAAGARSARRLGRPEPRRRH